jgi:hypothetical protein
MKIKSQELLMRDMYHGSATCVSQIDQIISGMAPFDELYDTTYRIVTNPSSEATSAAVYTLKKEFSRSDIPYRAGQEINRSVLELVSFKGSVLVTGRALLSIAKLSLRTIRKAIAISKQYVDDQGKPLHSGTTLEEIKEKILEDMYVVLKGKTRLEDVTGEEGLDVSTERDPDWFFYGWMAFLLYGPLQPPEKRMSLLEEGKNYHDKDPCLSRKAQRKEQLLGDKSEKVVEVVKEEKSEFDLLHEAAMATLRQQNQDYHLEHRLAKLTGINQTRDILVHQISVARDRANRYCPIPDVTNWHWQVLDNLEHQLLTLSYTMVDEIVNSPVAHLPKRQKLSSDSESPSSSEDDENNSEIERTVAVNLSEFSKEFHQPSP